MRFFIYLGACLSLAGWPAAQDNLFEIYPKAGTTAGNSATSVTTRLDLGVGWGEVLQEVPAVVFQRVADVSVGFGARVSEIRGYRHAIQDQDRSTPEFFRVVLRNAAGGPISLSPLMHTPPPRAGAGPQAWLMTVMTAGPIAVPNHATWYMGTRLPPNAAWPADGLSIHAATYYTHLRGDFPRGNAAAPVPTHVYRRNAAGAIAPAATGRVLRVGVLTLAPVLNLGCVNPLNTRQLPVGSPCYGAGGFYPDISDAAEPRFDGLSWRVRAAAAPGGAAAIYAASGRGPGWPLAGIDGTLALGAGFFLLGAVPLDGAGEGEGILPLGPGSNALRKRLRGHDFHFQALVRDAAGATWALTNLATCRF